MPKWLGNRMARLCAVIVLEYGRDELLRRLARPFWFHAFDAVMGMDQRMHAAHERGEPVS